MPILSHFFIIVDVFDMSILDFIFVTDFLMPSLDLVCIFVERIFSVFSEDFQSALLSSFIPVPILSEIVGRGLLSTSVSV